MFEDAFIKLDRPELDDVLKDVNPLMEGSPFNPETATILLHPLPFYPGWDFIEVSDHSQSPIKRRKAIHRKGEATILDGTNAPLYNLNSRAPVVLNADNILLYARFFFSHIRARHGKFTVVETVDDITWRDDPSIAARKAVGQSLGPLSLTAANKDGSFDLTAHLMYRDTLLKADIHITANGTVALSKEETLIEEIPVLDDTFGQ